jgi:hypothetical protein
VRRGYSGEHDGGDERRSAVADLLGTLGGCRGGWRRAADCAHLIPLGRRILSGAYVFDSELVAGICFGIIFVAMRLRTDGAYAFESKVQLVSA